MRFTDATGRQVVSTSTATTVGTVGDFVVDPRRHAVLAVQLKKSQAGDTLLWADITAFGDDAVTVPGADTIRAATPDVAALAGKKHRVIGKRTLLTTGDDLGQLADVEFDPATGIITELVLQQNGRIEGVRLVGIGSYAVVVQAQ